MSPEELNNFVDSIVQSSDNYITQSFGMIKSGKPIRPLSFCEAEPLPPGCVGI